jgi:Fe-S oxidoreductase/nitrate reductase gamma subunit
MPPALLAEIRSEALLTREIFGNIPGWAQGAFYVLAAAALAVWAYGIGRRARLWRHGRIGAPLDFRLMCRRLLVDVLLQRRFRGRPAASMAHRLLFAGFFVLLVGTTLVGIEHLLADLLGREPNDPVFHKGVYFGVYEILTDAFGVAFLAGCAMFLVRRLRPGGVFARRPSDIGILILLVAIGITGYAVEGLRILYADTPLPGLSPVGYATARMFRAGGIDGERARALHFALWWGHAALALGFIALMPFTRLLHALAGVVNLAVRDHALGVMAPVSMEEVEATGQIGIGRIGDFSRRQLVELDACVSCGRCQDACPAFEAGKPLSPRDVVQDLVGALNAARAPTENAARLPGDTVGEQTLWSCTTCGACADVCPLGISPMRMITDMRRFLIGEGTLRGSPATALQKTDRAGNPWGMAPAERMAWAAGLEAPLASEHADFDVLYWVGCAAAYDRRAQKVARSVVELLTAAQVNFAVLGPEERCTGESARRMGDELLFQQLAEQNVQTLEVRRVKRIVAHCPHCVNSLRNDYPQAGGHYEVMHHSELLAQLIAEGRLPQLPANHDNTGQVTYHDPCYLARANGVTEPPRAVLAAACNNRVGDELPILELARNRRETSCCGGGGGRMWFDDPAAERVGRGRVQEIAASGAATVAVACPFCLIMLKDGLAAEKPGVEVKDIAEVLAQRLRSAAPALEAPPAL